MEPGAAKTIRKKLDGKLEGLCDSEKMFATLICHGIAAGDPRDETVSLEYLDYFMWSNLIPANRPDYLKDFKKPHNDGFEQVYFIKALEHLEREKIIHKVSNGDYMLDL